MFNKCGGDSIVSQQPISLPHLALPILYILCCWKMIKDDYDWCCCIVNISTLEYH